jgi:transposase
MTTVHDTTFLTVLHLICCGLDVHKEFVTACLVITDGDGRSRQILERFKTVTEDLIRLREWLLEHECPIVAMESTGVYWRPVHNILEGYLKVQVVNARHIKIHSGRKTDMSDCQWIASLLRVGLLRGSFIPAKTVRQWRDVARYRKHLVGALGDAKRQVHKLLETSNIKIDSVVSDLFGRTGRNLMNLLTNDQTELTQQSVEECLRGKLQSKGTELFRAVQGFFEDHHRWMLRELLDRVRELEERIKRVHARLTEQLADHEDLLARIDEVPGINTVGGQQILSELGTDLAAFPNAAALSSWAGVCPGNNESGGKRRSGRSPVRAGQVRTYLVEIAWAAVRTKGTYFRAKYFSLRSRLGPKKAVMAIAHKLLKALYHIIKDGVRFNELGEDYLTDLNKESKIRYLHRQAEKLGCKLVPIPLWDDLIHRQRPETN